MKYSYHDFNDLWSDFNYEYLVLLPKDKQQIAEKIIGEDLDEKVAWQKTAAAVEACGMQGRHKGLESGNADESMPPYCGPMGQQ